MKLLSCSGNSSRTYARPATALRVAVGRVAPNPRKWCIQINACSRANAHDAIVISSRSGRMASGGPERASSKIENSGKLRIKQVYQLSKFIFY
jgi:hypothetical protein